MISEGAHSEEIEIKDPLDSLQKIPYFESICSKVSRFVSRLGDGGDGHVNCPMLKRLGREEERMSDSTAQLG